ncbi:Malate/lactate/ureidoglycolate dehydrogenase, LDH2 family [Hymenobacter daecheongensis DSM 21074]|uniref:Malate/lactate/ureidoglycolate dehydrogenase, LDH2 family n=1 Tax=Hymenobacter daecheongensis DSM 21074 TaxID=1121955 RepID=A0A1M6D904_9BACT|nr:Ldh family oxidoreductase [Hymenobacter daecheongensis]SHI69610.1 Malate/lactate/ureidoglycolate dehydrogenase, LDH2 family [Hymenobacter daecheongensis DSM 21074]
MTTTLSYNHLFAFTESVFLGMGCPEADATLATEVLLSADLRGIDSHGVARLVGYVRLWEAGRINATPRVGIVHETPSTAVVDGDGGLGLVVAPKAMAIALEKARLVGTGWVSVKNSNHFGIAGYHAMKALAHDMIGMAMTNASPLVAPTHSLDRLLGTNPIAVAIPAGDQPDFVADFATTTAANGKLEIAQRKQLPVPEGWVQNADGSGSTDANAVKNGGALLPLGGETGSHKGYCLGSIVDIFSAVLSGANYGPWVPPFVAFLQPPADPVGQGLGHFFGAMRIDAFRPAAEFKAHMDNWISTFRNAQAVEGKKVLIPGDPEREMAAVRLLDGIPLLAPVIQDLEAVGKKFGLKL